MTPEERAQEWALSHHNDWPHDFIASLAALIREAHAAGVAEERRSMIGELDSALGLLAGGHSWMIWAKRLKARLQRREHEERKP